MKRRRVTLYLTLAAIVGVCVVVFLVLRPWHRPASPLEDREAAGTPLTASQRLARSLYPQREIGKQDTPASFGILGSKRTAAEWPYSLATTLKWMRNWGYSCEVVAPPGVKQDSLQELLQSEGLDAGTSLLDEALNRLTALLIFPDSDFEDATIPKLQSYASTGGWLIVSSDAPLVRGLTGAAAGPVRKLNSMGSPVLSSPVSEARFLVDHPALPGSQKRDWFPIPTLEGEAEVSRHGAGLWLVAFRNPSAPGLTILPIGKGGVIQANWKVCKSGNLNEVESRQILRRIVAWLSQKRSWKMPEKIPMQKVIGKVANEDGSPVKGAEVTAHILADWGAEIAEPASKTDEAGGFSLDATGPAIYWFDVSAEGFLQLDPFVMTRCEEGLKQETITIVMRRTVTLSGTVCYEGRENSPAPEFPVALFPADRDPDMEPQTTTTDQQGRFAFEKVPYGITVLLVSQKEDWGGWRMVELPLDPKEEPGSLLLAIERLPPVFGRVIDHETLKPIPGARVQAAPGGFDRTLRLFSSSLTRFEESDEQKGFSFYLLPGRWGLAGVAENCFSASTFEDGRHKSLGTADMKVAHGRTDPECPLIFRLQGYGRKRTRTRFYGTVYFPSGEPAPNAFIWSSCRYLTKSDSAGKYETEPIYGFWGGTVDGVRLDRFDFEVRCRDCLAFHSHLLTGCPERCHLDFHLEEGTPAKGFVRDTRGNPVEGARVTAVFSEELGRIKRTWERSETVVSAADASFTLPGVTSRSDPRRGLWGWGISLHAEKLVAEGGTPVKYVGMAEITLPEYAPVEDFDIIIARAGPVKGTVRYHDGTPLRNSWGELYLCYREDGRLESVAGEQGVCLDDYGGFSLEVPGFSQRINLKAREEGRADWRGPSKPPPETYELDLRIPNEVEGSTIRAYKQMYVNGIQTGMTDLDVRLPPMGSIRAQVIDAETGLPAEGLSVQAAIIYDDEDRSYCQTHLTHGRPEIPTGDLQLLDLLPGPDGTCRVEIFSDGYVCLFLRDLPLAANQVTDLGTIALYRNWWMRGRIVAADTGQPIQATIAGPEGLTATTDPDGNFVLKLSAATSSCTLKITPASKAWQEKQIWAYPRKPPTEELGDILLPRAPPE